MRYLRSTLKCLAYFLVVLIVLCATVSVVVRQLTPLLEQYRGDIERYVSNVLHVPVTIKQVHISWRQYKPVIDLEQVTFHNKNTKKPVLTVQRVTVFFSIPKSIWFREFVTSGVLIDRAALSITQVTDKEYKVKELNLLGLEQIPGTQDTALNDVMSWVSQISNLTLSNIELNVERLNHLKYHLTLQNLYFGNDGTSHHIEGSVILHQSLPTRASIAMNWEGATFDLAHLTGKVYLYVSGLSLPQWLQDQSWHDLTVKKGIASARIWLESSQGVIKQVQTKLQLYGLKIKSEKTKEEQSINRISGDIGWKHDNDDLIIAGDDILLNLPGHLWPITNFYLSLTHLKNQPYHPKQFNLSYFDLQDARSFIAPFLELVPEQLQKLNQLESRGSVQNLTVDFADEWQDWQHMTVKGRLQHVSIKPFQDYPGVQNISGDLIWSQAAGTFQLNSSKITLIAPKIFQNNLFLDQATGLINFKKNEQNNWLLTLTNAQILNRDLALTLNGRLILFEKEAPDADITAHFTIQQAVYISEYLPLAWLDKDLATWLKQAFLAGVLQDGEIELRGPLQEFPFDQGQGKFNAKARLNHVDLRFSPTWPTINKIDGNVQFSGRKVEVSIDRAETLGIKTSAVHGVIPMVGGKDPAVLQVTTAPIFFDVAEGMNYIHKSPLEESIGKMFKDIKLEGLSQLILSLTIPLDHTELTKVVGDLTLQNASLSVLPYDLVLSKVTGGLRFTEDSVESKKIKSVLFNKPFQFNLSTDNKDPDHTVIKAAFERHFAATDIERWLKTSFSTYVDGSTDVAGVVELNQNQPVKISLRSNLKGLSIHADSPIDKLAPVEKDFSAELVLASDQPLKVKAAYDNQYNVAMFLTRKKNELIVTSANLMLGKGVPNWPTKPGLLVTGHLASLDSEKIKSYFQQSQSTSMPSTLPLIGIYLMVDSLRLDNFSLTHLKLNATPEAEDWRVVVDSQEIAGKILVPKQWSNKNKMDAQLSKVYLKTSHTSSAKPLNLNLKSLPAIALKIADLHINDMSLGQLTFHTRPTSNGFVINALNLNSSSLSLHSSGEWVQSARQTKTSIKGNATSPSVSGLMSKLGFATHNFEANKGESTFNLNWLGAPFEISMQRIDGQMGMKINGGRIVEVGKEGGAKMDLARMLSLFSLQTIPRRLLFDFSDVFQKGYTFDTLSGDFKLDEGSLFTRNMVFDGPIARLEIKGRIGVTNRDFDLTLGVSSHVTSSIPLAATILTLNPLVGVGAYIANALVGSSLSKATGYDYTIKGSWDNPSWQEAKPK